MKFPFFTILVLTFLTQGCDKQSPEQKPAEPVAGVSTNSDSKPNATFQKLVGKWERPDGGYVLELKSVDASGKFEAGYYNPSPINVERAQAVSEGGQTIVAVVLRDVNYPGCTYKLTYDPKTDQLFGTYFQASMQQTYDVTFGRLKETQQ